MLIKDIPLIRKSYKTGQIVSVFKPSGEDKGLLVKAQIIGCYPFFALVTDNKMRWCVLWQDLGFKQGA
jgi:hypothetical protein